MAGLVKRFINGLEEGVISLLLVAMTLLVFMEVVLRFVFGTAFIWTQELTLLMSAWFVLLGVSYGLKVGAHIGVDAVVRLFPPVGRRIVSGVAVILSLVYCGLFLYGSWIYLSKMKRIGIELEDLPIPTWVAHGILIIGFALLSLRLLQLLWALATGRAEGFSLADEGKQSMGLAAEGREEGAPR